MSDLVPNLDAVVEQVVVGGDLSKLSPRDRLNYYNAICKSVGLNPLTRPFDYLHLSGRLVLYAKRDATDQLRKLHGVSIVPPLEREIVEGIYVVTANARDKEGRIDSAIGAVPIDNLKGEARANAIMKAETKAKRRVTLSICGLGMLDETETGSIPDARPARIDYETGEVLEPAPAQKAPLGPRPSTVEETLAEKVTRQSAGVEDAPLDVMLERSILNEKIIKLEGALGYKSTVRAQLWDQFVSGDPRDASIEKLNDLLTHLKGLAGEKDA